MNADDHLRGQARPTAEQIAWVFHHLNDHHEAGGTFRRLIYDRLGLDEAAYGVLCGQGVSLSNLLNCARGSREVEQAMLNCYL